MAQLEVPVVTEGGVARKALPVTDIDVLGIRPSPELRWRYVIGDCKTKKKESPVNRVLWASGLMDAFGASSGIVILRRENTTPIERDHKLFADERRILLLAEEEFTEYDKAIVYPGGSSEFPETIDLIEYLRDSVAEAFPRLREHLRWLLSGAWSNTDHSGLLRNALGRAREVRGEIDPRRDDHLAIILENAAVFAVPFATLVGTIFRRHVKPADREDLDEAARIIIWGGREQYDFYNRMRSELVQAKGSKSQEPLSLPEWDRFLELLRSVLEVPTRAFQCPQVLRVASLAVLSEQRELLNTIPDSTLLHVAMRIATYVARAAGYPAETSERLKSVFMTRIGDIVESSSKRLSPGAEQSPSRGSTAIGDEPLATHPMKSDDPQMTLPTISRSANKS
ncbi:hypothetical protein KRR26_28545 [Corallococcus sp. M34]|uniref:hypothetical protein n=1 Tax=Citreicoccus inhibens TaxID=2849499 RepID=UPI001C24C34D|nr:hypothetical protein [Citreicoccus inhibens]MBU8899566.1 hypothetical protein [Citreicoccus inhibens]